MASAPMRAPWLASTEAMVPVSCVAIASRNAKSARQHARRQLELLGVLVEQAREHALTDVEFFGDLGRARCVELAAFTNQNAATCTSASSATKNTMMRVCRRWMRIKTRRQRQSHEGPRNTIGMSRNYRGLGF